LQDRDVLGVRPGATRREVTEAFRRFALCHHPDRGGDPSLFQAGVDAYRRLTDRRGPTAADGDVVFHRRSRPGVTTLLGVARRRLCAFRPTHR
jgi:curved DNA-binding protein CbpA